MNGYRELAAELRRRIDSGEFAVGSTLPRIMDLIEEYGLAKQTVRDAIGVLADDGLVVTSKRAGTIVRHRTPVRLPLSRYRSVVEPGGTKGPWETATSAAGLDGEMRLLQVECGDAPADLAELLELSEGDPLVYRLRHAVLLPDDLVQVQHAWYPRSIAEVAGLDSAGKVHGGAYGALTAAGFRPRTASETVESRPPTPDEAAELRISGRVWVATLERLTRDAQGQPLEVLRAIAPADRLKFTYDDLPL
ncbi:GntR family transcriptional regulator [Streptomyces sp. B-S-A8]|uniref:GntR family transcriptional regulator n=1 Tax=Streptomyces solicavernae TaxID=3043614 RepID=A0ABT6S1B4_9ACTN|nr:GntR family transcriptional regulator [Streptomyces sp. B-S-A8]MDI3390481.1 GntR family transcriptional regulator [Streptomyces sp. B-S-A8]